MPRFAILEHDFPSTHWDLFLEAGNSLRSWRVLDPFVPGKIVPLEPVGDHRLLYLDYEGPVSNNRGIVSRIDAGTFLWKQDAAERIEVDLTGTRFQGTLILERLNGKWTGKFEELNPAA